ncbi:hypothetical protein BKA67DRAFT_567290 [Truncatella angustata]|uniref:Uncharacterized protein n=1 Tax=Truncatella angustata TaxID=152316 RepID=A0A9P8UID3_9PEZI|nr:uncharacterized protein BKA67DRAFT_567290 [Truncatella angustata]KAH6652702.1 hypothetical protein BKA67DRAFT_567290 [Truncatella angustata]
MSNAQRWIRQVEGDPVKPVVQVPSNSASGCRLTAARYMTLGICYRAMGESGNWDL